MFESNKATRWRKKPLHGFCCELWHQRDSDATWNVGQTQTSRCCHMIPLWRSESFSSWRKFLQNFPLKLFCFVFSLCRTASSLLEGTIFGCFSSHGSEGELGSGGLKEDDCLRAGACGSRASQELLFTTCAWIAPADADGGFAGSGGRLPTAARRRHPEESGSGELPRCSRHTAHLTWGHGRRGKGRRIQAEDAYLQKR